MLGLTRTEPPATSLVDLVCVPIDLTRFQGGRWNGGLGYQKSITNTVTKKNDGSISMSVVRLVKLLDAGSRAESPASILDHRSRLAPTF